MRKNSWFIGAFLLALASGAEVSAAPRVAQDDAWLAFTGCWRPVGDGGENYLCVVPAGDGVRIMLGDGRGSFKPAPGSPFSTGKGAWRLAVGDVNGDGKPDIATSNLESDNVTVLLAQ